MKVDSVHEDGIMVFKDGNTIGVDFIIHCSAF